VGVTGTDRQRLALAGIVWQLDVGLRDYFTWNVVWYGEVLLFVQGKNA